MSLNPKTFETAVERIKVWDKNAGDMPLLSEQVKLLRDDQMTWSLTHNWPAVMNAMVSMGLIREASTKVEFGFRRTTTEITELGKEVRSHLSFKDT